MDTLEIFACALACAQIFVARVGHQTRLLLGRFQPATRKSENGARSPGGDFTAVVKTRHILARNGTTKDAALRFTILLVNDERAVRESLCWMLTGAGWQVTTATSEKKALLQLQHFQPDLIATYVSAQSIPGRDFLEQVRELYPRVPLFVISDLPAHQSYGVARFATEFFQKPVNVDVLLASIRHYLDTPVCGVEMLNE